MAIAGILLLPSCTSKWPWPYVDPNEHHCIYFVNDTDIDLYVGRVLSAADFVPAHSADSVCKLDDSGLWGIFDKPETGYEQLSRTVIRVFDENNYNHQGTTKEKIDYTNQHTLVTWTLTLEDLQRLNWRLTYPPTEEMEGIQTGPSYY